MRELVGFLFTVGLYIALEIYVFNGLKVLFKNGMPKSVKWIYWSLVFLPFVWAMLKGFVIGESLGDIRWFSNLISGIFFTLIATKAVFAIFILLEDFYRIISYSGSFIKSKIVAESQPASWGSRREFVGKLAVLVASIPFMSFLYGVTRGKYAFTVHNVAVEFPDLPDAFDGFKILQISDIHSGSFDSRAAVSKGVEMIKSQKADMILFTGDLVNSRANEIEPFIPLFATLDAPFGKYSVLGNHDYGYGWRSKEEKNENIEKLKSHHQAMGFNLMMNESLFIEKNNSKIRLAGVENWGDGPFPKKGDLVKTFENSGENEFTVLMSHDPSHWENKILDFSKHIHLTLSGHTHGLQLGIEIPGFKFSPSQWRYPQWAGLYEKEGKKIYVNRGFGFLGFPGRVGILPEITVLELKKKVV
jgi:predicted MPP superfamily phosphohydrolase